jgi:hypothetical protein
MEEVTDFDTWIQNYTPPDVSYWAIYNPETGEIIGIYPDSAAQEKLHKIKIERDMAEDIMNGVIRMNTCFVDSESETIEIVERYGLRKIDDIVHRIPSNKYVTIDKPDISIVFNSSIKSLTFQMSDNLKSKKVLWTDETNAQFLITAYNDPYQLLQQVTIKLDDLKEFPQTVIYTGEEKRFSIFTRRLFKKYILIET